ncbi:MAG: acyltransferase family protein [Acidimicrobiales bacterium]
MRRALGHNSSDRAFRADIQGLRAVAVIEVVFYHAHLSFLGGGYVGVDVFFVISGFLITDLLWRERVRSGRVSLRAFYGRRARRLLPMAMVVLVITMVASLRWVPPLQLRSVWKDGVASALYGGNYRFAAAQANYLTSSGPASPFQQYWSLGVEEQFYLVWPLLLLLASTFVRPWSRGRGTPSLRAQHSSSAVQRVVRLSALASFSVLALVASGSFVFSLWLTRADQPWAFFSLPTRAWELAVGGLVALAAPVLRRLPVGAAIAIGWAGLAAVVASAIGFGASTPFPGTAALVPVLGAAAILTAGLVPSPWGPVAVLGTAVMGLIGAISYSWYLWHWPVLVLAPYVVGHALSEGATLALAVGSGVLAWATYRLVEEPGRRSKWLSERARRSLLAGLGLSTAGACTCLVAALLLPTLEGHGLAPVAAIGSAGNRSQSAAPGRWPTLVASKRALLAGPGRGQRATTLTAAQASLAWDQRQVVAALERSARMMGVPSNLDPSLADASASEAPPFFDGCLLSFTEVQVAPCVFGDLGSATTVVLFGDSHAAMWFPAVDAMANARHWRLVVWTKATCPPVDVTIVSPDLGRTYSECDEWRAEATSLILAMHPLLVILGMSPNYDPLYDITEDGSQWLAGLSRSVTALRSSGARVLVLGPVESPDWVVPDCLSAHLDDVRACNVAPTEGHAGPGLIGYDNADITAEQTAVVRAGGTFVNVKPWFCAAATCPVVVDNLLVFRDNSHITVPYAAYLAPLINDEVNLIIPSGPVAQYGRERQVPEVQTFRPKRGSSREQ